jgi:hypothetical protein
MECDPVLKFHHLGDGLRNVLSGLRVRFELHYQQALSIWKSTGNRAGEGTALANLANIRVDQGDLAGAKQMFLDVLVISRELGGTDALTLVELADAAENLTLFQERDGS